MGFLGNVGRTFVNTTKFALYGTAFGAATQIFRQVAGPLYYPAGDSWGSPYSMNPGMPTGLPHPGSYFMFGDPFGLGASGMRNIPPYGPVGLPPMADRFGQAAAFSGAMAARSPLNANYAMQGEIPAYSPLAELGQATSTGLTRMQNDMLNQAKAAGADAKSLKMMEIQFKMQNMQETMQLLSQIAKMIHDIRMAIIRNISS